MTKFGQRRRVIKLLATGVAAGSLPVSLLADGAQRAGVLHPGGLHQWQGFALGAEVSIQLYHPEALEARRIIEQSVRIIRDMEGLFSLYQPQSTLSRLNQQGEVDHPPRSFVDLLRISNKVSQMTSGAFDVTVQPLWQYYHSFFSAQNKSYKPEPAALQAVRDLVGYEKLSISDQRVAFDRPKMAATLNGIAQGYVTDRVADFLKSQGLTSVLVDIGEYRALGPQADGTPWRIGLADPQKLGQLADILDIHQGAVATSSGIGDIFEPSGEYHHLFDPHSGKSAHRYLSVTVTAPEATLADALSTAFCSMSIADIKQCLHQVPAVTARLTDSDGSVVSL